MIPSLGHVCNEDGKFRIFYPRGQKGERARRAVIFFFAAAVVGAPNNGRFGSHEFHSFEFPRSGEQGGEDHQIPFRDARPRHRRRSFVKRERGSVEIGQLPEDAMKIWILAEFFGGGVGELKEVDGYWG